MQRMPCTVCCFASCRHRLLFRFPQTSVNHLYMTLKTLKARSNIGLCTLHGCPRSSLTLRASIPYSVLYLSTSSCTCSVTRQKVDLAKSRMLSTPLLTAKHCCVLLMKVVLDDLTSCMPVCDVPHADSTLCMWRHTVDGFRRPSLYTSMACWRNDAVRLCRIPLGSALCGVTNAYLLLACCWASSSSHGLW